MKTTKKIAYFCVAVLSNVFCLTSCFVDEKDIGYETERGVVKTEFTISIPAKPAGTRMAATTVQASEALSDFRGIQDIKLYSFKAKVDAINGSTGISNSNKIDLTGGTIGTQGASGTTNNTIASSGALNSTNYSHLYKDIEVLINTQAFMFYGEAIPIYGDNTPTTTQRIANGELGDNLSSATKLGDITFSPVPIHASENIDNAGNGVSIASYLTSIATAAGWSGSDNVILRTLYNQFITIKAGSWASVKGAVQQLYSSIFNRTDAVSGAIKTAILADSNVADSNNDGTLEFTDGAYGNYPADICLPDGAAYVLWNGSAFDAVNFPGYSAVVLENGTSLNGYYTKSGTTYTACDPAGTANGTTVYYKQNGDNTGLDIPNLSKFVYPAPLYYRVLSNIRTANASKKDVYSSASTWNDVLTSYGTDDVVKSSTRSIAIEKQVQYAVGRLDAIVYTDGVTTLKDNENSDIPIKSGDTYYFPITGILIGGQKAVDYKFEQKTSGEAYTIYDNAITGIYMKETADNNNATHTLAFETQEAAAANNPDCVTKISVEFRNDSGSLFVGKDGEIIYPGSKFYLVGTFDPYQDEVKYTGTSTPIRKTFVQDYTTTAKLKISSLKSAYNTVPDLRAPQLELGLSVDITWQTGIDQTINIQ